MAENSVATSYTAYFVDMNLERREVFETVRAQTGSATVLYPGSFIHIAPSYYFQHVVYIDRQHAAVQFFADAQDVLDYVRGRKRYKQQPYIRFIAQDYTTPLPLREQSFDLLIALYATGAAEACHAYLKPGGLLLSNNHHDDAGQALRSGAYDLIAAMFYDGDTCRITDADLEQFFVPKPRRSRKKRSQPDPSPPEYTHNADYYLLKKL